MINSENRPEIPKACIDTIHSQEEYFQNTVIRQVIKMKHELILTHVISYIRTKSPDFINMKLEKQEAFLTNCFAKDQTLKSELRGMLLGSLTISEYTAYLKDRTDLNKRINSIIKERIIDHLPSIRERL